MLSHIEPYLGNIAAYSASAIASTAATTEAYREFIHFEQRLIAICQKIENRISAHPTPNWIGYLSVCDCNFAVTI